MSFFVCEEQAVILLHFLNKKNYYHYYNFFGPKIYIWECGT